MAATYVSTQCKSLINRMKESLFTIRTYSIRLTANLYSGCVFDCPYCYAPFIYKFNKDATPEEFGSKIFVKENAIGILDKQITLMKRRKDFQYEYVDLGTITDCYQPIEGQQRLTRGALEVFVKHEIPVTILTKSDLVARDIDLLKQLAEKGRAAVGFSITISSATKELYKSFLEPKSPSTKRRLEAIRKMRAAGIPTYVFVNPVVPCMSATEENIRELFKEIADTGNTDIFFGVMKLTPLNWGLFRKRLEQFKPELLHDIQRIYLKEGQKEFNRSWIPSSHYREELYSMARDIAQEQGIGFSCEGGQYHLWLNDWAHCEQGYNYPTGYNLWSIIKEQSAMKSVSYEQVVDTLKKQYLTLRDDYFEALRTLWNNGQLFDDLPDIKRVFENNITYYRYDATRVC